MKKLLTLILLLWITSIKAQKFTEVDINIPREIDSIYGTLVTPDKLQNPPLAIIISGSGPTDRNGNSMMSNNNSLKYLAYALGKKGIASYRFDKSIVKLIQKGLLKEDEITFSDLINDTKRILSFFKKQHHFSNIFIIGHSQGSLVGMIAAQNNTDGFISLAGAGHSIDIILNEQLEQQIPNLKESYNKTITILKNGKKDPDFNPVLSSLFRMSIQGFLIDWMQYNPQIEIKKLNIPVLLINGTKDLQVSPDEARALKKAKPEATLKLIENMNHILKEIQGDAAENYSSYNQPEKPVMVELVQIISQFINNNNK